MDEKYILGIDAGTTRITVAVVDRHGVPVAVGSHPTATVTPQPGYAEQCPAEFWDTTHDLIVRTCADHAIEPREIAAIGIANQRETTVFWSRKTGQPLGNAIVWLDRRAVSLCEQLRDTLDAAIVERVGMPLIPNTAAVLITWLLRHDPTVRGAAETGDACFGTVNSWLLHKLTGGAAHCCDIANMSVTQLQNAARLDYDAEVLDRLHIPRRILPVLSGTGEVYGRTCPDLFSGARIPIAAMLGDQMAAALGQGCVREGMVKSTFGTGSFCVMNTGSQYVAPAQGLFSPVLWGAPGCPTYGVEAEGIPSFSCRVRIEMRIAMHALAVGQLSTYVTSVLLIDVPGNREASSPDRVMIGDPPQAKKGPPSWSVRSRIADIHPVGTVAEGVGNVNSSALVDAPSCGNVSKRGPTPRSCIIEAP